MDENFMKKHSIYGIYKKPFLLEKNTQTNFIKNFNKNFKNKIKYGIGMGKSNAIIKINDDSFEIKNKFNRKLDLDNIERKYSIFSNDLHNKYNPKYLNSISDLLSNNEKNYLNKRKNLHLKNENINFSKKKNFFPFLKRNYSYKFYLKKNLSNYNSNNISKNNTAIDINIHNSKKKKKTIINIYNNNENNLNDNEKNIEIKDPFDPELFYDRNSRFFSKHIFFEKLRKENNFFSSTNSPTNKNYQELKKIYKRPNIEKYLKSDFPNQSQKFIQKIKKSQSYNNIDFSIKKNYLTNKQNSKYLSTNNILNLNKSYKLKNENLNINNNIYKIKDIINIPFSFEKK
jgi:hypothetical protein